eukprot:8868625-Pyramimonas_sp.AAC.1
MRFTELLRATSYQHRPRDVLQYFDSGRMELAIDHYTDCLDFWPLCCGIKGVPRDKNSRLSIRPIREKRLTHRIRWFIHCPTHNMIMTLVSTSIWKISSINGKQFTATNVIERKNEYNENDLLCLEA